MKNLIKLLIGGIALISSAACSKDETVSYDWFPFPIEKIEPATIDVASRKWHHPYFDGTEEELNESNSFYILREHGSSEWVHGEYTINNFSYESGYEYTLQGSLLSYVFDGGLLCTTFMCERILSKVQKDSENLPPDEIW